MCTYGYVVYGSLNEGIFCIAINKKPEIFTSYRYIHPHAWKWGSENQISPEDESRLINQILWKPTFLYLKNFLQKQRWGICAGNKNFCSPFNVGDVCAKSWSSLFAALNFFFAHLVNSDQSLLSNNSNPTNARLFSSFCPKRKKGSFSFFFSFPYSGKSTTQREERSRSQLRKTEKFPSFFCFHRRFCNQSNLSKEKKQKNFKDEKGRKCCAKNSPVILYVCYNSTVLWNQILLANRFGWIIHRLFFKIFS